MTTAGGDRIRYLDSLRGVAILWVMLFHIYVVWPEPFANRFSDTAWLSYGWLGVELFFMISGYVILMTLEKCTSLGEFLFRRWLRLFPAMLVCSLFIYLTAPFIVLRPAGAPVARDLLPGLTLVDPDWLQWLLGGHQRLLEGSFWTLFVEVKFYVIAGVAYYVGGTRLMVLSVAGLFGLAHLVELLPLHLRGAARLQSLAQDMGGTFFGWFAAGAMYYVYERSRSRTHFLVATLLSVSAAALQQGRGQHQVWFFALWVSVIFGLSIASPHVRRMMCNRFLLWVGFISYPLYLLHENFVVGSLLWLERQSTGIPDVLQPLGPAAIVMGLAWFVARHIEPAIREWLRRAAVASRTAPAARSTQGRP
jgi:peptidoglycan/LPS O-acetylase OafA/YrhL